MTAIPVNSFKQIRYITEQLLSTFPIIFCELVVPGLSSGNIAKLLDCILFPFIHPIEPENEKNVSKSMSHISFVFRSDIKIINAIHAKVLDFIFVTFC